MSVTIDGGTGSVALTATASGASLDTNLVLPTGTANSVAYLNGSKVLTTGSALTFDGTTLLAGLTSSTGTSPMRMQVKGGAGGANPLSGYSIISGNDEVAGHIVLASSGENSVNISVDPQNLRASSSLQFSVDGTERARFNSTGAFVLQGGNTSANGVGITFPATQSASSDANTLDDYEEGTFTVGLTPDVSGSITVNTSYNTLSYTKIGRLVTVTGRIQISSVSSPVGNALTMTALPFAAAAGTEDSAYTALTVVVYNGSGYVTIPGRTAVSSTTVTLYPTVASITNSYLFIFGFTYIV